MTKVNVQAFETIIKIIGNTMKDEGIPDEKINTVLAVCGAASLIVESVVNDIRRIADALEHANDIALNRKD